MVCKYWLYVNIERCNLTSALLQDWKAQELAVCLSLQVHWVKFGLFWVANYRFCSVPRVKWAISVCFLVGGWANPLSSGRCSAPLPRCEGVWMPSCSLCDPAKTGLQRADTAKQGGLQCLSSCAVGKQESSLSSAVHLAPFWSTKTELKKNLREKEKDNWCYLLDIL